MTTYITRLYADVATAEAVAGALVAAGHNPAMITVIPASAGNSEAALRGTGLPGEEAEAFAAAMGGSQAVVVAEAGFNPIGAARRAMIVVDRHPSINVPKADKNAYVLEYPSAEHSNSLMKGNPLVMSNPYGGMMHGHIFGENNVTKNRTSKSARSNGGRDSRMFWPMRTVSTPARTKSSAISGGRLIFPFWTP